MSVFEAIIQGIIQGLTEFLPVSSSGHLTICQHLFGMDDNNLFFSVMLHIGTLAAVLAVYCRLVIKLFKALVEVIKDIIARRFKWSELRGEKNLAMMIIIGLIPLFLLFLPIPGTDMKLKDLADLFTKDGYFIIIGCALVGTSVLLFLGGRKNKEVVAASVAANGKNAKKGRRRIKVPDAIMIGLAQCAAALFPGLSRSGTTLAASELRGINKQVALDYSFLLGTPAILAAALLECKDVLFPKDGSSITVDYFCVVIGMIFAAVVGFIAIKLFRWLLSTDRMYIFILYTGIVGLIIIIMSIIELATGVNLFTGLPLHF